MGLRLAWTGLGAALLAISLGGCRAGTHDLPVLSRDLECKICAFVNQADAAPVEILIAGDSRGERGVVARQIETATGQHCVNVAYRAGDMVTLCRALKKYPKLTGGLKHLVVSIGSYHLNDSVVRFDFMSAAAYSSLTRAEVWKLYGPESNELREMSAALGDARVREFRGSGTLAMIDEYRYRNNGFLGVTGVWDKRIVHDDTTRSIWAKAGTLRGVKYRLLLRSLSDIDKLNVPTMLFLAPASPRWLSATLGTKVSRVDSEFAEVMSECVTHFRNIRFLNLVSDTSLLADSLFYDPLHMNTVGAEKLTAAIVAALQPVPVGAAAPRP